MENLNELVKAYISTKNDADDLKKVADRQNAQIKKIMSENNYEEYITDNNYVAKYLVQTRTSMNEDMLLEKLKMLDDIPDGLIKTKEYVDTDMLENLIYKGDLDKDILDKISSCVTKKEVVQLRISKVVKK